MPAAVRPGLLVGRHGAKWPTSLPRERGCWSRLVFGGPISIFVISEGRWVYPRKEISNVPPFKTLPFSARASVLLSSVDLVNALPRSMRAARGIAVAQQPLRHAALSWRIGDFGGPVFRRVQYPSCSSAFTPKTSLLTT